MNQEIELNRFLNEWATRALAAARKETATTCRESCISRAAARLGEDARAAGIYDQVNATAQKHGGFIPFVRSLL
ncbi:hypothetical protein [Chenggangzhangella methanolivorans]|uniref:Uncharacterized protein n=1 Tax=Chenggangzhangella methanolivorans TaxID=1437009 RepID=A0A9E6RIJ8_9HYPH|nr:hypothetical protein [Chenggangzhangella methanolivorans]QZO02121.1 hypothetical protein K6K41_13125 [Chenggangzhangella methanolivorans]